jgi:hypothetical protein
LKQTPPIRKHSGNQTWPKFRSSNSNKNNYKHLEEEKTHVNQLRKQLPANNGESANVTKDGNKITMELLSDGGTTVVDLKPAYAKRVKQANIKFKLEGCATTPIAVAVNFGLGTESRGLNWLVGTQSVDFQSRKLLSMTTSQPTNGSPGSTIAESAWNMRWILQESSADVTVKYGRNGFTGTATVSAGATGKHREGQTNLRTPEKLGALPAHFFFIAPVIEQGLHDSCRVVITKFRVYY